GSGPYVLGGGIRAGTDRVALEVRDRLNAARIVAREELVRYTDYEIDYQTGAILLRRPVPSEDVYGNPMFVVATVEQRGIGASRCQGTSPRSTPSGCASVPASRRPSTRASPRRSRRSASAAT